MQHGITGCELETICRADAVVLTRNSSGICLKGLKKTTRNIRLRMLGPPASTETVISRIQGNTIRA
jgi:hypothetical protein